MYKRQGANWQIDAVTDRFTRSNKYAIEITKALNTRCNGRHMVLRVDQHQLIDRAIPGVRNVDGAANRIAHAERGIYQRKIAVFNA